jgi:hypothetical protein
MTKKEALEKIEEYYETLDEDQIYNEAPSLRVGSGHEEDPRGGGTYCVRCGRLEDNKEVDPVYHPEHYL